MDTVRDREILDEFCRRGTAPWQRRGLNAAKIG
jgi:hypothetical protein